MTDPELQRLIMIFGEIKGRRIYGNRQAEIIERLQAESAKYKAQLRTGTETVIQSLILERQNLNSGPNC